MILKKLKIQNIRSYEDAEVEFPLGSVLLSGDIGSGKTSVLLAIEFALFGLQPGQKGASLLRSGEKEGHIFLEFEVDNKKVIIERTLKRGKTVSQEEAFITIDDERKETSVTELKNLILTMLNYPQEFAKKTNLLYRFTVYTPQEEMKQIITESSDVRLDTLRHVFGIDKYKRIKENTDLFTIRLREEIRNKQGQIQDLDDKKSRKDIKTLDLEKLKIKLVELEKSVSESSEKTRLQEKESKEIEEKIQEKKNLEHEIDKTKLLYLGKKELLNSLEKDEQKLTLQLEESKKFQFSESELLQAEKTKLDSERLVNELNNHYFEIIGQINSLTMKKTDAEKLKSGISRMQMCPTCLQNVEESYRSNILNKLENDMTESKKKVSELTEEKTSLGKKIEDEKRKTSEADKKISELKILRMKIEGVNEKILALQEIAKKKQVIEKDIDLLNKHIDSLKISVFEFTKYDTLYRKKLLELEEAKRNEKLAEMQFAASRKEIEMTKLEIAEIEKEIEKKEKVKKNLAHISELEDWLSENFLSVISFTEKNVMLKLKEEFSKLFNEWFNILVPDTFTVHLDDDFTPIIEQQDYELDYSFLSGGERTAIALAYRLALNQTINSLLSKIKTKDIVILDEPTDGFSDQQLDKMRDVLAQLKVKQLILVSHEAKIESFVSSVIKFKKESGVTRIEK